MASIWMYSTHVFIFIFCAISIFMLSFSLLLSLAFFFSLTIAYEVSLQNTNVLQSPWKQWEERGGQGTVREFLWCWHCYQMHSSLVCVRSHVWHMFKSVFLKALVSTYVSLMRFFQWLCVSHAHACEAVQDGCQRFPPRRCQAPLSCSWLFSQTLCRVSQLRSVS